ncbi:uncharacterized protein J8A68_005663 [[Candida] subhashii]|uniref:Uncharacterized protein n=1 Tax=[Candida] subhashii TaxID=561895 RepID=A0A8J5Q5S9_9ASCO|nr:uncharacterized protein J8A68_005663 [[Candida] subhashii]KAG7660846.1 hypothetical protein J8A68_005663 [[Candida] subhashii]
MNNLYTALSLSLIANNKRFAISSSNSNITIPSFKHQILQQQCKFKPSQIAIIDLLQIHSTIDLINQMVYSENECDEYDDDNENDETEVYLKNIIIWQNVQHLSINQHKSLYKLLLQLDEYEMNIAKFCTHRLSTSVAITIENQEFKIIKPEVFTIICFLDYNLYQSHKLYIYLKEKIWLSINYHDEGANQISLSPLSEPYLDYIVRLRKQMSEIYVAPDIKRYIYSLIVHIRCHRLASISPKSVRVPTMTFDYITDFCKALVLFKDIPERFVTPDYVKIATRIIGYWLVDWEYNRMFSDTIKKPRHIDEEEEEGNGDEDSRQLDYLKRLQITILNGDWFGCDYFFVNEYLKHSKALFDNESPTGYSNKIIEDALTTVRPPL